MTVLIPSHTRGKENDEPIDIENVDGPAHSESEHVEEGRPIRKRKATVPFDEDTEMDTDELLEKEVKTKKKPAAKPKAAKAAKDPTATVKAPKKTTKKSTRSAFSDDEDGGESTFCDAVIACYHILDGYLRY